jgi:plastocyanin
VNIDAAAPPTFGRFNPMTVPITAGDKVTWNNRSTVAHTVTRCTTGVCDPGSGPGDNFDSGSISAVPPGSYSHEFKTAGTYNYYCKIHGYVNMHGTVTVSVATAASQSPQPAGATPSNPGASPAPSPTQAPSSSPAADSGAPGVVAPIEESPTPSVQAARAPRTGRSGVLIVVAISLFVSAASGAGLWFLRRTPA